MKTVNILKNDGIVEAVPNTMKMGKCYVSEEDDTTFETIYEILIQLITILIYMLPIFAIILGI